MAPGCNNGALSARWLLRHRFAGFERSLTNKRGLEAGLLGCSTPYEMSGRGRWYDRDPTTHRLKGREAHHIGQGRLTSCSSFGCQPDEHGTLKQGSHTIVLRPQIKSANLCAEPDALWRIPPVSGTRSFRYSPVRFVRNEKVSRFDKLILAFDAFALSRTLGNPAR